MAKRPAMRAYEQLKTKGTEYLRHEILLEQFRATNELKDDAGNHNWKARWWNLISVKFNFAIYKHPIHNTFSVM